MQSCQKVLYNSLLLIVLTQEWKIDKSQMMGSLDCRSLGYFHISRHSLQRIMLDNADFLIDSETVEYFNILKEDHKNVVKFA